MIHVAFNDLPQVVRARFSAAARYTGPLRPLFYSPLRTSPAVILYALATAFLALWELGAFLATRLTVGSFFLLAACSGVFLAFLFALIHRFVAQPKAYRDGYYVFPTALVKAELGWLTILPVAEVGRPQLTHFRNRGAYAGTRIDYTSGFEVQVPGEDLAVKQAQQVLQAKDYCARVHAARDAATLQQIDVFFECTMSNRWENPGQVRAEPWEKTITVRAALARVGVAVGIGVLFSIGTHAYAALFYDGPKDTGKWQPPAASTAPPAPAPTTPKRR
jgi:hypothetical protein